ncbi:MAG: ferritin-like domain-containing protein, partial [Cyanobacteria bacterium P01_C01_bin.72]
MNQSLRDSAGEVCFRPNFFQTKGRVNYLIDHYLSYEALDDRLEDLAEQLINPQPRRWSKLNWQDINPEQVIGLELDIFLSIIQGALETEAPIRS